MLNKGRTASIVVVATSTMQRIAASPFATTTTRRIATTTLGFGWFVLPFSSMMLDGVNEQCINQPFLKRRKSYQAGRLPIWSVQ